MASTDAKPIPQKNVAYRVTFPIFDADGDLVTGAASLDSEVSKDGGTFADCTNEATEIATSSGMYYLDLTSTEMNADTVAIIVKTGTSGAKTTPVVLYPEEAGDIRVNVTQVEGSDATDQIRDAVVDDATRIDASALNTLSGYAPASTIASATNVAAVETDTQDIQSRIPAALVSGRMSSDAVAVSGSTTAADNLEASTLGIITGQAVSGTLSTTQMTTNLSGYDDDRLIGRVVVFTGAPLAGEATEITDYASASGLVTFTAVTEAPTNGCTFVIV